MFPERYFQGVGDSLFGQGLKVIIISVMITVENELTPGAPFTNME